LTFLGEEKAQQFIAFLSQKSYYFKRDELEKLRIDLTFSPVGNTITSNQLDYVRNMLSLYPEIKPITYVLKRIFHLNNLNQTFNGGLSSFSLFLMILAHTKLNRNANPMFNLTKLLSDLLQCYGDYFDFYNTLIDVNLDK
jgi:DNA polymerase sigma